MASPAEAAPAADPSTTAAAAIDPRLARWEQVANPVLIAAAIVPIAVVFVAREKDDPFVILDSVSWLVFLADLVVHIRLQPRYLRTLLGKFDLAIVVLTFPWFLIPGLGNAAVLSLARLGRLGRLALAGGSTGMLRRVAARLGKAGAYSLVLVLVCSEVTRRVEPPSAGFDNFGTSLWWGIVTFTTVGYGNIVPVTSTGRFMSVILMFSGVALIGVLAGSLSEFFTGDAADGTADATDGSPAPDGAGASAATVSADGGATVAGEGGPDEVLAEVRSLRTELAELRALLGAGPADGADAGA